LRLQESRFRRDQQGSHRKKTVNREKRLFFEKMKIFHRRGLRDCGKSPIGTSELWIYLSFLGRFVTFRTKYVDTIARSEQGNAPPSFQPFPGENSMINKFVAPAAVAMVAALAFGVLAKAEPPVEQKASPTPTAKPQNQSVVNSTKSNVKDHKAVTPSPSPKSPTQSKADKGWDGKVQGVTKLKATPTPTPTPAKSR
jgi:hypothetical protein